MKIKNIHRNMFTLTINTYIVNSSAKVIATIPIFSPKKQSQFSKTISIPDFDHKVTEMLGQNMVYTLFFWVIIFLCNILWAFSLVYG